MKHPRLALSSIVPCFCLACGGGSGPEPSESLGQAIVRGEVENGRPQVVQLTLEMPPGFAQGTCTGTYIAPRVVLTAAHCIPTTTMYTRVLVYQGNNYLEDYPGLTEVPAPGTDSPWALADSWETHPDWDPAIVYPDLGIVYLDRPLPIEPLPIGKWRLEDRQIGQLGQIVGYGATKALSADIQQHEGEGIKRSGYVPFLGSPPQEPKPEDPHPGLDLPEVRQALAMFDGTDPWPNGCAGDSGGPVIMNKGQRGREYTLGVASWTANYCEGFSYYTRLDPFVSYLDGAMKRAGREPLLPTLQCVSENPDGQLRAHFGYINRNGISLDVAYGYHNFLVGDSAGVRPTHFLPGHHAWAFALSFSADQQLVYWLKGPVGRVSWVRAHARSQRCDPNDVSFVANQFCENVAPLACTTNDQCVSFWADTSWVAPECLSVYTDWLRCNAALSPDRFACFDGIVYPFDVDCSTDDTLMCLGM
jgi:hypothetical protein